MTTLPETRHKRAIPRAEPVGSLLRDQTIKNAINQLYAGIDCTCRSAILQHRSTELQQVNLMADQAIPSLIQRQLDAGLDVVTDGEMRRNIFLSTFYDAVDGLESSGQLDVYDSNGTLVYSNNSDPVIRGKVRKAYAPLAEEASYLRALGTFPYKLTLPAPSYFYMSDFVPIRPGSPYKNRQEFIDDVVEIEQTLIAEAIAAGARWIQLDFPLYPALVDDAYVAKLDADKTATQLLDSAIAADRKVVENVPPDVTLGLHLCRGNIIGGFWNGSLERVAERMFNELPFHRFLVEWEDVTREGDYSALKHVPKGPIVALGLVSTKDAHVESDDDVVGRLDEASQYLSLEQLALTSQCGFASLYADSNIEAEAAQWEKLELIGRVADRVWGSH